MNIRAMTIVTIATGLTIMLGGCEILDAYTQEAKISKATKGARSGGRRGWTGVRR